MNRQVPDGHTVKYEHHRLVLESDGSTKLVPQHVARDSYPGRILPVGGRTVARVFNESGTEVGIGIALCRYPADDGAPGDNFNRKLGRIIALGRALKRFGIAA